VDRETDFAGKTARKKIVRPWPLTAKCDEGGQVGRKKALSKGDRERLLQVYYTVPLSLRDLGKMFGVSRMTAWRAVNER